LVLKEALLSNGPTPKGEDDDDEEEETMDIPDGSDDDDLGLGW
jgi:hypothetical protein